MAKVSSSKIKPFLVSAEKMAAPRPSYGVNESVPVYRAELALVQAREGILGLIRPILRQHGLTDLQWRVLLTVRSSGEVEVTKLAHMCCLLAPSLSRVLRDLAQRGFLQRRAPAADQRRSLVSLSEEGEALMSEVFPRVLNGCDEVKRLYGPKRLELLRQVLVEFGEVIRNHA
ncbi:MAG: MarR family transcriptional regulator [Alphaproteobacteria bacterium]